MLLPVLWAALYSASQLAAQTPGSEGFEFFEKRIRPLLADRCWDCHSQDGAESQLQLDSLAGMLRGGMRGPAIVPGQPETSLLVSAIRHGELLKMPPKEKLATPQIADLVAWIGMGAPWPDAQPVASPQRDHAEGETGFTAEQIAHWAFQNPVLPKVPAVRQKSWVRSPIDAFILKQLEDHQLAPAPAADRRTLIRRATFDLTGLPPTPAEVAAFLADRSPDAFARVVDRLLHSSRYGQRWGRHWLDVARYADSNGLDENLAYGNAFHYRDYVVAAWNRDKPFDQFLREQLAGDLLPPAHDPQVASQRLAATGFLSLGAKMLAEDDPLKMQMDIIDEQVDTIGRAFMGLTLGCARCHDHKFDPITTSDYYALAGIFKSTRTMENFNVVARWQERPLASGQQLRELEARRQRVEAEQAEIDRLREAATAAIQRQARQNLGRYLLAAHQLQHRDQLLASATAYGPRLAEGKPPGAILIEAEDYDRGNVIRDRSSYGPGIGVLVNRGELPNFVEYDIELPQGGVYQLELRLAAAASRPCQLAINGTRVKSDAAGQVTGTWYPDSQTWYVEGFFELEEGRNIIRLEHPQFFPHIDKLLFVPSPAATLDALGLKAPFEPSGYELIPEFTRQWARYLSELPADGDSPLRVWNHAAAGGDLASLSGVAAADAAELLADTAPASLDELAWRYQQRAGGPAAIAEDGASQRATFDERLRRLLADPEGPFAASEPLENHFPTATADELAALRQRKEALQSKLPRFPEAMAVSDEAQPQDIAIHTRGSHLTLGRTVPRGFPGILCDSPQPIDPQHSGRLELARWLTRPEHPLTARVIVNRVWLWHFGEGLVRSPDNFGRLGERPTHPQLLDWLAVRLRDSAWSLKQLHRTIMLSSTYQMSTAWNEEAARRDPENRLWWRMNRRRLEAEAIRDALLASSRQLDLQMGGSLLPTENRAYVTSTANVDPVVYDSKRRSIYLPVVRSALLDVFQAFDFADPSVLNGQRETTTVAPQALFMMNSEFVSQSSAALADWLLGDERWDDAARIRQAYLQLYSRPPSESEVERLLRYVSAYSQELAAHEPDGEERRQRAWQSLCRALFSASEFIYVE